MDNEVGDARQVGPHRRRPGLHGGAPGEQIGREILDDGHAAFGEGARQRGGCAGRDETRDPLDRGHHFRVGGIARGGHA